MLASSAHNRRAVRRRRQLIAKTQNEALRRAYTRGGKNERALLRIETIQRGAAVLNSIIIFKGILNENYALRRENF